MLITITTSGGVSALINPAHITHITPSNPAFLDDGSVIHFTSEQAIQVPERVGELAGMLEARAGARDPAQVTAFPMAGAP